MSERDLMMEAIARLARIEALIKPLLDNGQPGLISALSSRVRNLENEHNRWRGALVIIGGIAMFLGGVLEIVVRKLLH